MKKLCGLFLAISMILMEPLFPFEFAKLEAKPLQHFSKQNRASTVLVRSNSLQQMRDTIASIEENHLVAHVSHGNWSMHQMLGAMVEKCGNGSEVHICTWTFTHDPIAYLATLIREEKVGKCMIVTDHRSRVRAENALVFAKHIAEVYTGKVHAKVCLVKGPNATLANVGSANFTRNPRHEAGVLFRMDDVYEHYRDWIEGFRA